MPEFISKLQHKNYEKGEFSDEKPRNLTETIDLVKSFPWSAERGADIQLKGPSVTIRDENINYLKLALYFNGKFCVYYLDRDNHLYEYHATSLDEACSMVTDFFNGQLDLQKFEKHIFNIGNKPHFKTAYFEYHIKLWRVLMLTSFIWFYAIMVLAFDIGAVVKTFPWPLWLVAITFSVLFFGILGRIYFAAINTRNNYLQISKGNNTFSFGCNEQNIKTYQKSEVSEILKYENRGSRNPNMIEVFEIVFKNGDKIKLSNMLIPGSQLFLKFCDNMDNSYVTITQMKRNPLLEL